MPASICDTVSSALRLSLTNTDDSQSSSLVDSRLYSSAKNVLLSTIEFEESGDYQSNVLDGLKSKYVVIRPKKPMLDAKFLKKEANCNSQTSESSKNGEDSVPKPKRVLFPVERVQLGWQGAWAAGAGMQNVGNTCYLNSTLQALFHVPAFANWLVSEAQHADKCNQQEACVICGMRATLIATQKSNGAPIKPWQVYSKLRLICRHLTPGRQEDAHEFLRYLVEAMEKCYLSRFGAADKFDQYSKESTPLNQILGGYLRSTVRCLACHHLSTTYQHFQDLLLDIRKPSTLDEALDSFFSRERLEDLGYKCEACNKKVSATKQFFVERAPMVLCVALKRFSLAGGKLSKHVQFRRKISLNKYLYNKNSQQQLTYKLVSMVTHLGPSQNCGHYTAIGQAPNTNFYQFDDSCVRPLPLSTVLGNHAYIMFFERDTEAPPTTQLYGPQLPDNLLHRAKSPAKLTFYRHEDRKHDAPSASKGETKPIILNSTLGKSDHSNSEPWTVKQNGEVEKVSTISKILNTGEKTNDRKINFVIKRPDENGSKPGFIQFNNQRTPEKTSKLVKPPKSPLEKLEEQMNNTSDNHTQKNGNGCSKLVPYDSESESGDERAKPSRAEPSRAEPSRAEPSRAEPSRAEPSRAEPSRAAPPLPPPPVVSTQGMQHAWTVSSENSPPLRSPSLNGVTNNKETVLPTVVTNNWVVAPFRRVVEKTCTSPASSVSTLSPPPAPAPPAPPAQASTLSGHNTLRVMQQGSLRGYGAPVHTWAGTNSHINRQVQEERREERKRTLECTDDMDRGRVKKMKNFNHHYNRFNNDRNNYNPFQDKQNKQWNGGGGGFKYRGDRRPPQHFHNKHYNNKYKRFNRYGNSNGHHYPRHH